MTSDALTTVANAAQALLDLPALRAIESLVWQSSEPPTSQLVLDWSTRRLSAALSDGGCSVGARRALVRVFEAACEQMQRTTVGTYVRSISDLWQAFDKCDEEWLRWTSGVRQTFEFQFARSVERCEQALLDEVRSARARHASLPASSIPEEPHQQPGTFTKEVLEILNNAFLVRDSVSRAERRQLAGVTRLTERQILTWFANQRQRRGKNKRASPYETPRRPSSQRHHSSSQLRTVSGSSTLSSTSSASLLRYAAEPPVHQDVDWYPPSQQQEGDLPVDLPISASASFASFAQRFQVAALPLPGEGDLELPMMELTSPTPVVGSFGQQLFPSAPLSNDGSSDSASPPLDVPVDVTSSASFFSTSFAAPLPISHAASHSPANSSSSSSFNDDSYSYFSSCPSGYVPAAPAPSLFDLSASASSTMPFAASNPLAGVDSWMDETFYRDLFGSLGLTQPEMGTEGGAGMVVDEGGLTLSMDAVEADVGGGMGMGGRFGYSF